MNQVKLLIGLVLFSNLNHEHAVAGVVATDRYGNTTTTSRFTISSDPNDLALRLGDEAQVVEMSFSKAEGYVFRLEDGREIRLKKIEGKVAGEWITPEESQPVAFECEADAEGKVDLGECVSQAISLKGVVATDRYGNTSSTNR